MKLTAAQRAEKLEHVADMIEYTLDHEAEIIELCELRENGETAPLSKARRDELLAASRAGQVVKLELDAVTFRQSKVPRPLSRRNAGHANARFVKIRESDLSKFAKGFRGRPMLRDHDRNDLLKRGGTVRESELRETATHFELVQKLELVKPWAVEGALDGTLQTFSIAWDPPAGGRRATLDSITCTVCECSMFLSDCPHLPGDEHKVESSGETVIVEAEFRNPRPAETSGVSFPAVTGTKIESIRAALSEARSLKPRKARRMNEETLRRLGLPADATPEQIDARIAELNAIGARTAQLETELRAAQLSGEESAAELKRIELEAKAKAVADRETRLAAAKANAVATGLWAPGDERELLFDDFAKLGVEHAERYAKSLTPITPVGQPMVGPTLVEPNGFDKTPIGTTLSSVYMAPEIQVLAAAKTFAKLRITPEMFERFGPHTWECRDADEPWLNDGAGSLEGMGTA